MMEFLKRRYVVLGTILFDLFLLWTVVHFVFGGWERTVLLGNEWSSWGMSGRFRE